MLTEVDDGPGLLASLVHYELSTLHSVTSDMSAGDAPKSSSQPVAE